MAAVFQRNIFQNNVFQVGEVVEGGGAGRYSTRVWDRLVRESRLKKKQREDAEEIARELAIAEQAILPKVAALKDKEKRLEQVETLASVSGDDISIIAESIGVSVAEYLAHLREAEDDDETALLLLI